MSSGRTARFFNSGFVEVLSVLAQAGVEESVLEVPAA